MLLKFCFPIFILRFDLFYSTNYLQALPNTNHPTAIGMFLLQSHWRERQQTKHKQSVQQNDSYRWVWSRFGIGLTSVTGKASRTSSPLRRDVEGVVEVEIDLLVILAMDDSEEHLLEVATAVVIDEGVKGLFVLGEEGDLDALEIDL